MNHDAPEHSLSTILAILAKGGDWEIERTNRFGYL